MVSEELDNAMSNIVTALQDADVFDEYTDDLKIVMLKAGFSEKEIEARLGPDEPDDEDEEERLNKSED